MEGIIKDPDNKIPGEYKVIKGGEDGRKTKLASRGGGTMRRRLNPDPKDMISWITLTLGTRVRYIRYADE